MAVDAFLNWAECAVVGDYSAGATSIEVADGSLFPVAPFNAAWVDSTYSRASDDPNKEMVRVTAKAGNIFTITRAQEGTTATAKSATTRLDASLTAKTLNTDLVTTAATAGAALVASATTGDVTFDGSLVSTIGANAVTTSKIADATVTLAKMANMATDSIIGRATASSGAPEVISALPWADTGDVTRSVDSTVTAIANNAVTLGKMATMATDSILGRATAGTGNPEVLTALPWADTGDVTRAADATATAIASDAVTNAKLANMAQGTLKGRAAGAGTGDPSDVTTLPWTLTVPEGGTGAATLTGLVKGNGTGAMTAATAETDYVTPSGSGTLANKTLTTPTIGDLTNANHTHQNAAGGGTLNASAIGAGTLPVARGGTGGSTAIAALDSLVTAEATVASATTTDLGAVASQNVQITGTVTITGFGTVTAGVFRRGRFAAALTLTHNATSLILPGAASITTSANDRFEAYSLGAGNWIVTSYIPAAGYIIPFTTLGTPSIRSAGFPTTGIGVINTGAAGYVQICVGNTYCVGVDNGFVNLRHALLMGNASDFYLNRISSGVGRITSDNTAAIGAFEMGQRTSIKTTDFTVLAAESGSLYLNSGAAGAVNFTLPTPVASPVALWWDFHATTAQKIRITAPASVTIQCQGTTSAAAGNVESTLALTGVSVRIMAVSTTQYVVLFSQGALTTT